MVCVEELRETQNPRCNTPERKEREKNKMKEDRETEEKEEPTRKIANARCKFIIYDKKPPCFV